MSLNHVTLMGRITADLELRATTQGKSVTSFSIAVERDGKGPNGEKQTDFFEVIVWGKTAEFVCNYFGKGRQIIVDGRLQTRGFTDRNGNKRKAVEIVAERVYFADSKPAETQPTTPTFDPNNYGGNGFALMSGDDSDLPLDPADLPY